MILTFKYAKSWIDKELTPYQEIWKNNLYISSDWIKDWNMTIATLEWTEDDLNNFCSTQDSIEFIEISRQ